MYAGAVAALLARGSGATPWGWQLVHDALHHRDGELGELVQRPLDQPPALLHLREGSRPATAGETPVGEKTRTRLGASGEHGLRRGGFKR